MITPSFSLTATERVLPKLALDFTTASLDPRVTLTRALNTATCVNSSGNVTVVNADLPRFDYNPTTLVCKGLLIEESRINSIRNNTMVGTVAGTPGTMPTNWITATVSGLTRQVVGTGTENGISYIDVRISGTPAASGTYGIFYETPTGVAAAQNQTWTSSQYVKIAAGSTSNINSFRVYFQENNSGGGYLTEQNITITTPTTASLISQRYSASRTLTSATAAYLISGINITFTINLAIDVTIRIGLPQLEQGAFATSVIQTSGTAVTRNADVATMTGTNFSDWYNASEGTFDVEGTIVGGAPATYPYVVAAVGANVNTDSIGILWGANSSYMRSSIRAGGVTQTDISGGTTKTAGSTFKVASAYKANSFQASFDGSLGTEDTSGSLPTVNSLTFCGAVAYQNRGNYIIRKFFYYPQRLINANVQSITYG